MKNRVIYTCHNLSKHGTGYILYLVPREAALESIEQCEQDKDCDRECDNIHEEIDPKQKLGEFEVCNYEFAN